MKTVFKWVRAALALASMGLATGAFAQMTPVGVWHSIDDKDGKPKAEIRIADVGAGVLNGKVERSLRPDANTGEVCDKCEGDRKGKPKIGMEIIRGAKKAADKDVWEGGTIVDPDNGTEYKLKLTPIDGGNKLEVRGFVGFALLGRTQTWVRAQ